MTGDADTFTRLGRLEGRPAAAAPSRSTLDAVGNVTRTCTQSRRGRLQSHARLRRQPLVAAADARSSLPRHGLGVVRPPPALRGHRRRGYERPRAGRARARRRGHRLGPLGRLLLRRAPARRRDRADRGPRRRQRAGGRRGRLLDRDPAREPRARRRRERAAPRRPARRADAPAPDDRRLGHPRQDHDLEHARPRAARRRGRPGLPGRRGGALDRLERGLGGGGVAGRRGRRVRPLAAQARAPGRGAHQRRARPPRDLLLPARRRGDVPRVPRPGGARGGVGSPGAAGARRRRHAGCGRSTRRRSCRRAARASSSTASRSS